MQRITQTTKFTDTVRQPEYRVGHAGSTVFQRMASKTETWQSGEDIAAPLHRPFGSKIQGLIISHSLGTQSPQIQPDRTASAKRHRFAQKRSILKPDPQYDTKDTEVTHAKEQAKSFGFRDKLKFNMFIASLRYLRRRKDYLYIKGPSQPLFDDVYPRQEQTCLAERGNRLLR